MAFTSNFHSNTQPHHFDTIAKHLLRSRQTGDTSKCDIRLILRNDQQELVHSCVIMGHSGTLSAILNNCRPPYAPIDLTSFDEMAVRRVVNWMYCGSLDSPKTALRGVLAVAAHLRVSQLLRELEHYLRSMSMQGDPIFALNTATADSFTVSEETILNLTLSLASNLDNISDGGIASLSFHSIIGIMATLLPAERKVPLVNMAIRWLQIKNADMAARETVTRSILISDQDGDNLFGIRTGLIIQLKKNNFDVRLVNTNDGGVAIRTRPVSYLENRPRTRQTRSQLSILDSQPDPFQSNFEIAQPAPVWQNLPARRGLTISSLSDQNVYNGQQQQQQQQRRSDYSTFGSLSSTSRNRRVFPTESQIGDLHTLPEVFEGSPYRRQLENPVEQSQSLQDQLAAIPDPFSPRYPRAAEISRPRRRRNSDQSTINSIPDPFIRADIMRHNVDHEHLNQIPNPFGSSQPARCQLRRQNSDHSRLAQEPDPFVCRPTRSPLRRHNSDHSRLAELPDPFVSRPTRSPLRKQNSDHSRLAELPDPFVSRPTRSPLRKQNSDHSRLAQEPDPFVSRPTRSPLRKQNSDHSRLAELPDPFLKTRGELYRQHVDHEHLKDIADPFMKTRGEIYRQHVDHEHLKDIADPFTKTRGEIYRQQVDHEHLNEIADPFRLRKNNSDPANLNSIADPFLKPTEKKAVLFKPTSSGFPKAFTKSEVDVLKGMDDPFDKTEKSNSNKSVKSIKSIKSMPRPTNCFGGSRPANRALFQAPPSQKQQQQQVQRCGKRLEESELEHLRNIPDPFAPVVMNPVSQVKSPAPSANRMGAPLQSPRVAVGPATPRTAQENSEKSDKKATPRSHYLYPK